MFLDPFFGAIQCCILPAGSLVIKMGTWVKSLLICVGNLSQIPFYLRIPFCADSFCLKWGHHIKKKKKKKCCPLTVFSYQNVEVMRIQEGILAAIETVNSHTSKSNQERRSWRFRLSSWFHQLIAYAATNSHYHNPFCLLKEPVSPT